MADEFKPGDVLIDKILISSKSGSVDIKPQVTELNIYEDISKPYVYAEIVMLDALGLIEGIPLIGQESVNIKITTPGLQSIRELILNTYKISNIVRSDQSKSSTYILQAVSPSLVNNSSVYISKGYHDLISNIVKDIAKNYCQYTSKPILCEATKGTQNIVIPKLHPYQAIDLLRKRAASLKNNSSSYMFFENQLGLFFITLEELILNNTIGNNFFCYYGTASSSSKGDDYNSIIEYYGNSKYDFINKISQGGMASNSFRFDLITKAFLPISKSLSDSSVMLNSKQPTRGDVSQGIISSMRSDLAKNFIIHDSSQPDTFLSESRASRDVYMGNYENNTTILVHGNISLTAGQKVNIKTLIDTGETNPPKLDSLSGNYLIAALRHKIAKGNRPKHSVALALINDSYS